MRNLLAACKNIGTTHITNGAYRLHPVEWNIGEAAGVAAAHCVDRMLPVQAARHDSEHLKSIQDAVSRRGVPLAWPQAHPV